MLSNPLINLLNICILAKEYSKMNNNENKYIPSVNQRVLGSSPREGA